MSSKHRTDDLPARAIEVAKNCIIDTVGVALAGARDHAGAVAISLAKDWGGKPVSVVMGGGFKTSAPNAAFANGTSAHALDFDDRSIPINHFNAGLVPCILALGEAVGASGRKVLESFILGYEIGTRIGTGFNASYYFKGGWHPPNAWGAIGTAAGCAKLLGLDVDQTRIAFGIASSSAGGIRKHYGTNTKPLHCGMAARNGVVAAELAQRGFTADIDVLDQAPDARDTAHKYFSFPQVFCGTGNFNLSKMVAGLGSSYHLVDAPPAIKLHPGSVSTNRFIDLVIETMAKHNFKATDVAGVNCFVTKAYLDAASPFPEPLCPDEARYSLPYQIAATLLDGNVWIDQHQEARMAKADIKDMMARVTWTEVSDGGLDPFDAKAFKRMEIPKIAFNLRDGRSMTVEPEVTYGDSDPLLGSDEILAKYRDCAGRAIGKDDVERSIDLVDRMEQIENIAEYMAALI